MSGNLAEEDGGGVWSSGGVGADTTATAGPAVAPDRSGAVTSLAGSIVGNTSESSCTTADQRGVPRSDCDIGAYELVRCHGLCGGQPARPGRQL